MMHSCGLNAVLRDTGALVGNSWSECSATAAQANDTTSFFAEHWQYKRRGKALRQSIEYTCGGTA